MCFSAEASFTAGAILLPAGAYCLHHAARKKPSWLPLAFIPFGFGVQQISEGVVWLALDRGDEALTRSAALVFLFFALSFWPFWISFQAVVGEEVPIRRRLLTLLAIVNTVWFWVLYFPLVTGPAELLQTRVVHHSIQYVFPDLAVYKVVSRPILRVLYFLAVGLPLVLSSSSWGRLPGLGLAATAGIAVVAFGHAFVSVWCFFAAAFSIYLCVAFRSLSVQNTAEVGSPPSEQRDVHASRDSFGHT